MEELLAELSQIGSQAPLPDIPQSVITRIGREALGLVREMEAVPRSRALPFCIPADSRGKRRSHTQFSCSTLMNARCANPHINQENIMFKQLNSSRFSAPRLEFAPGPAPILQWIEVERLV